ncbi:tyrosine-type recombinase/integrase [Gaiella sp.]|uniref:tyrosine-type recombinase/integrase n=1 Tax=Gaiella sp. TaxID=2663207 RepID=UPI0039839FD9
MTALAPTLQAFFTDRLITQRNASQHTIAAYRDTMRLLLRFAAEHHRKAPSDLDIDDLNAPLIGAFLDHLEQERGNSARTRNARLAAIRSLFRYAALSHPEHAATIQRVLSIPPKRFDRALVSFLTETELDALLSAPDRTNWTGRRDHALILLAAQTGLRASELIALRRSDIELGHGPHVSCLGKGRKHRITPLTTTTITVLRGWLRERAGQPTDPLFPSRVGTPLSRDALEHRLNKHAAAAAARCPSLHDKRITAHVLRHTAAMRLLQAGVDTSVIALWLGHEQAETTQIYLHADLALKEQALARTKPPDTKPGRYRPPDTLLAFLEAL